MGTKIRLSTLCLAMVTAGFGHAADLSDNAKYTTRVAEDRLFLEDGQVLRCDLSFCAPDGEVIVAPKGSRLEQSVPPVVWQYSRLLPAKDYLKTAHVHSVSSKVQQRPWDDVQLHFYDGLLIEGASDTDAKIAYAGAYAFSTRWSFVDLVEVDEPESKYPDSILFRVEYTQPQPVDMTVEEYRALSLQILQQPENMSLQDIQAAIDESKSSGETKLNELARLGDFSGANYLANKEQPVNNQAIFTSEADLPKAVESVQAPSISESVQEVAVKVKVGSGILRHGGGGEISSGQRVEVKVVEKPEAVDKKSTAVTDTPKAEVVSSQGNPGSTTNPEEELNGELVAIVEAEVVTEAEVPDDEWIVQPEDGTLVLRDVGNTSLNNYRL